MFSFNCQKNLDVTKQIGESIVETHCCQLLNMKLIVCLFVCLFNGMSTQKGQFVPIAEEKNWLRQQRIANEIQCTKPYVAR